MQFPSSFQWYQVIISLTTTIPFEIIHINFHQQDGCSIKVGFHTWNAACIASLLMLYMIVDIEAQKCKIVEGEYEIGKWCKSKSKSQRQIERQTDRDRDSKSEWPAIKQRKHSEFADLKIRNVLYVQYKVTTHTHYIILRNAKCMVGECRIMGEIYKGLEVCGTSDICIQLLCLLDGMYLYSYCCYGCWCCCFRYISCCCCYKIHFLLFQYHTISVCIMSLWIRVRERESE